MRDDDNYRDDREDWDDRDYRDYRGYRDYQDYQDYQDLPADKPEPAVEKTSNLTVLNNVLDLDRAILKLIGRRCHYIAMLRRHRGQRDAVAETNTERDLRLAWEEAAQSVSSDPKLARQMFTLLQEIKPLSDYEQQAQSGKEAFNLAPSPEPADIDLPLIPSLRQAALHIFMSAASGSELRLPGQILHDGLIDLIKALNQVGGRLAWDAQGLITGRAGDGLRFADKVVYAGEDPLHFYLLSALALASPGKVKFTGGSGLKLADLSVWRNTLPAFGARQAHLVPKSNGLPVHIECSAMFPDSVDLPAATPQDGLVALLLAAPFWETPIKLNGAANPAWATALAEALPVLKSCGVIFSQTGDVIQFDGQKPTGLPESPALPLDPLLSALFLAIAAFHPGRVKLAGALSQTDPEATALSRLLKWAGVALQSKDGGVSVFRPQEAQGKDKFSAPKDKSPVTADSGAALDAPPHEGLPAAYTPVLLLLAAARAKDTKRPVPLPPLDFGEPAFGDAEDLDSTELPLYAREFLDLLGADYVPEKSGKPAIIRVAARLKPQTGAWTAPSPVWALCLALGAYLRPQIKLANPGAATELLPNFWHIYNGLPKPTWQRTPKEEKPDEKPRRRRIIAGQ